MRSSIGSTAYFSMKRLFALAGPLLVSSWDDAKTIVLFVRHVSNVEFNTRDLEHTHDCLASFTVIEGKRISDLRRARCSLFYREDSPLISLTMIRPNWLQVLSDNSVHWSRHRTEQSKEVHDLVEIFRYLQSRRRNFDWLMVPQNRRVSRMRAMQWGNGGDHSDNLWKTL